MKNKRKDDKRADQGAPGWMVTYGDLMTLLLVFFVLLFSFSSIELVKFRKAIGSLKGALGVLKTEQSMIKLGELPPPRTSTEETMEMRTSVIALQEYIEMEEFGQAVSLERSPIGITLTISNPILFDIGKAELKPQAYPLLNRIAEVISKSRTNIRIEGHTCDLPISTPQFPSNWELSAARAVNVLRYFTEKAGVDPWRLSAVGYGEYQPLLPNDTGEHRARNRRVTIRIEYIRTEQQVPKSSKEAIHSSK